MLCFILSCDQVKARVGNYILRPSIGTKQLQCMTLVTAKKNQKKNTVVTYHFKAALYLALSHLSQTRGSSYDII